MKYPLHKNETGSFQELVHASDVKFGQLSILTVAPRCRRGGHYHKRKTEWFCCIRGECYIVATDVLSGRRDEFALQGDNKEFVQIGPYQVHTVLNPSGRECELLVISSEEYDPEDTDTYRVEENANA